MNHIDLHVLVTERDKQIHLLTIRRLPSLINIGRTEILIHVSDVTLKYVYSQCKASDQHFSEKPQDIQELSPRAGFYHNLTSVNNSTNSMTCCFNKISHPLYVSEMQISVMISSIHLERVKIPACPLPCTETG